MSSNSPAGETLRVEGVSKSFTIGSRTLHILRGVSFEVRSGELVAITGPSGIGKTTLLHIIGTLDEPDSGEIHYGATARSGLSGAQLAAFRNAHIGFVFQFFQLLPEFTALENVMMPLLIAEPDRSRARARASAVLGEVGLSERRDHYPSQLSGGEQQRAAIARALVREPRLLLADEPTGNLDIGTGKRVFDLFRRLQRERGLTSLIVTHNLEIASLCDRILDLKTLTAGGEENG
jgi:lipoprotein-releasing system ATP-binding protein